MPLSTRSLEALKALAASYKDFLTTEDALLSDICYTASLRRGHHNYRLAIEANSKEELAENLEAFLAGETRTSISCAQTLPDSSLKLAFVFSGMGQQWWAMGQTLLAEEPVFRETIQQCDELLRQYTDWSLLEELTASEENSRVNSTQIAQCAIFSVQVALSALWRSWGIVPEAIVGHSVGEVAAAHVAGVLSLLDAIRVIFHRSRLQASTAGQGKMLAVGLSLKSVQQVLVEYEDRVSIAAINSPQSLTLAGETIALEEIAKSLEQQQIFCRLLQVEVPYHSPLMEPLQAELVEALQGITPQKVEFHKALLLGDEPVRLQLSVERNGQPFFNIHSQAKGEGVPWVQRASGNLLALKNSHVPKQVVLDEIVSRCTEISKSALYERFQKMGLEYGPTFLGISQLWSGETEALAKVTIPSALEAQSKDYQLHRALLDACFQVIIGTVSAKQTYLPVQIKRLRVYGRLGRQLWSHIRRVEQNNGQIKGDIELLDESGNLLVEIQGFCGKSLGKVQESVAEKEDYLYEYQWELKARPGTARVSQPADYLFSPQFLAESLSSVADRLSVQLGRKYYYSTVAPQIDILSAAYVLKALGKLGFEPQLLTRISAETLTKQLGIVSQHHRLLGRMLEILNEDGVLHRVEDEWEVCRLPEFKEPIEIWKALLARFPAYQAELMLLGRCGDKLAEVLRGSVDPLQLIFPEGSLTTSEHFYQDSPSYRIYNLLVQKAVAKCIERLPEGRKMRILEIGGGTGSMTSYVLPILPKNRSEYVFTDVTQLFTTSAQHKFSDYPFIEYRVLDIETDPISQGFDAHSFDLILASDVLHATCDLSSTLENVKQLLASLGLLVFIELTDGPRSGDLIFGMLKGWWLFSDLDLRPAHPLLSEPKWQDLLHKIGFEEVAGISDTDGTFESVHTVFFAQGPQVQPETQPELTLFAKPQQQGSWLIFADRSGVGQELAIALKEHSEIPILIEPGDGFKRLNASFFQIRPENLEDMQQLVEAVRETQPVCHGIVHLWSLDITPTEEITVASLEEAQTLGVLSVLHLVQALERVGSSPRLRLVTRGAQAVGESVKSVEVAQSPLWGLGRVISNEFPKLQCTKVDISPMGSPEEIQSLFAELWSDDGEDEIALRGESRYVHRLVQIQLADIKAKAHSIQNRKSQIQSSSQPFRLEISKPGILDNLMLRAIQRPKPGLGEIEIEVCATGLNFKDVAKAMNLLADVNLEKNFTGRSLGIECAGVITAIGSSVEGFHIGDEIIAIAPHSFSTHLIADSRFVVHKPVHINFEEAATIPAVFLTAYYALHELGRIRNGERVLIHAAAGGVGLAAIARDCPRGLGFGRWCPAATESGTLV